MVSYVDAVEMNVSSHAHLGDSGSETPSSRDAETLIAEAIGCVEEVFGCGCVDETACKSHLLILMSW